jgi:hypothetical protein
VGYVGVKCTCVQIEADMRILLLLVAIIVRPSFSSARKSAIVPGAEQAITRKTPRTYTWIFRICRLAVGVWGWRKLDMAITAATQNATVVKKPKTFCPRTKVECIVG